jgi:hypothetical protein
MHSCLFDGKVELTGAILIVIGDKHSNGIMCITLIGRSYFAAGSLRPGDLNCVVLLTEILFLMTEKSIVRVNLPRTAAVLALDRRWRGAGYVSWGLLHSGNHICGATMFSLQTWQPQIWRPRTWRLQARANRRIFTSAQGELRSSSYRRSMPCFKSQWWRSVRSRLVRWGELNHYPIRGDKTAVSVCPIMLGLKRLSCV